MASALDIHMPTNIISLSPQHLMRDRRAHGRCMFHRHVVCARVWFLCVYDQAASDMVCVWIYIICVCVCGYECTDMCVYEYVNVCVE